MDQKSGLSQITSGDHDHSKTTERELRIRDELEEEVERGLEDEIKDGIYRLALRLRRVYENKEERMMRPNKAHGPMRSVSEVNISIKMDGGTKVEIREAKKEARSDRIRKGPALGPSGDRRGTGDGARRLEWANSLRPNRAKKPFRFAL